MKMFCLAAILASAAAAKSAMRGVEVVDLADQKNPGDPDATVKSVTVTSASDPTGVTMESADSSTAYKVKVECVTGFSGLNCEINDNDCVDTTTGNAMCLHKSTCTDGIASFACDCTGTGYEDTHCATASVCIRGAQAVDIGTIQCSVAHGTVTGTTPGCGCTCDDGWTGADCSQAKACINDASGKDGTRHCEHSSTVKGFTDACTCDCSTAIGYEHGPVANCEVHSACVVGDAGLAGTKDCSIAHGTIGGVTESCTCDCADGYEGHNCATPSQCIWGDAGVVGTIKCDTAHGTIGGNTDTPCSCTCAPGWEGADCSTASVCVVGSQGIPGTIECSATGTVNGNTDTPCSCDCDAGYEGADCSKASTCVLGAAGIAGTIDCKNGAGPTGVTEKCGCDCSTAIGYEGFFCAVISDDCFFYANAQDHSSHSVAKCQHNGACTDGGSADGDAGSYTCDCADVPYHGSNCELPSKCINDASGLLGTHQCKNGGTTIGTTLNCECDCLSADGYEGAHCGKASQCIRGDGTITGTMKCDVNHGVLTGVTGSCDCSCKDGWTGKDCSTAKACISGYGNKAGTIACAATGMVSGFTASGPAGSGCECNCNDGFEGADCSVRSQCVSGDAGVAGTIKCSMRHGSISGTTGSCVCSCSDGYEGEDCSKASKCIGTGAGSGKLGFDAVAAKDGTLPCDLSKGDIEGTTGVCNCRCHTGYEGDACIEAKACTRGDGVTPGTVKCHSTQGTPTGTTGTCACDCTDNSLFHGPDCSLHTDAPLAPVHKTCTGLWSRACGQGCMHNACTAQGGVWVPLDYRSNPYTCEVSSSSSCPARYSAA